MKPNHLPDQIKQYRKAHRLTQEEFADLVGATRGQIASYESGSFRPKADVERAICKLLDIDNSKLLYKNGKEVTPSGSLHERIRKLEQQVEVIMQLLGEKVRK